MKSIKLFLLLTALFFGFVSGLSSQEKEVELTIEVVQKGTKNPAAWIRVQTADDDNLGGWYQRRGTKGFPAFSPAKINVPPGEITVSAWNTSSELVSKTITVAEGKPAKCRLELPRRFNLHKEGYFSFDSHNHLNGYEEKNRPPFIYPYCAALGIDHLGICQGWMFGLRMPASYDSIVTYLRENSTPQMSLRFGAECPKLRYGHTWYVNHPGLEDPLGDYIDWHDSLYFEVIKGNNKFGAESIDLRGALHPRWRPPFVDRILSRKEGAVSFAAHPTRWWHNGPGEIYPATNIAADLTFDVLAAQSYDGIVVVGDRKDHLFYQYLWFHLLNRGHRLIPVAESDGNVNRGNLGFNMLTHVWTGKKKFNFDELVKNVKAGHTMVSGKAVMLLKVDGKLPPGTVLPADGKKHSIRVNVFSEPEPDEYVSYVVLYRNGKVAEILDFREQKKREIEHEFIVSETETAWYLVKSYGKNYPDDEAQFDILNFAEQVIGNPDLAPKQNSGISMTAPVYFNAPGWQTPQPVISDIHCRVLDNEGQPLKNTAVEVWNTDKKLAEFKTDELGSFRIKAPATIDVRFTLPDGRQEQQWLFYEYPPLVDIIEEIYTVSWAKKYPGLSGGQMPWKEFRYDEIADVLKKIDWTIRPNGKIMMPGALK